MYCKSARRSSSIDDAHGSIMGRSSGGRGDRAAVLIPHVALQLRLVCLVLENAPQGASGVKYGPLPLALCGSPTTHQRSADNLTHEFPIGPTGRESAGSRVRAEEVQRLVGALKTKLGGTYDDLVNRETSFYGFDPDAPVKRHDNWRGTKQARDYISELLDKNGIR